MNTISKKATKDLMLLRQRKFRRRYKKFIVEGDKICRELLSNELKPEAIYALPEWFDTNANLLKRYEGSTTVVSERELKKISSLTTTNKVLAVVPVPEHELNQEIVNNSLSIYLDTIQDPGNFGTIIRIADWFGINHVFYSKGTVDPYNPKVLQASMGSFLRVKTIEMEFEEIKNDFPELPIIVTVLNGNDINTIRKPVKGLIVTGNEGNGISEKIIAQADVRVTIPKAFGSEAESLNAAVATGIIVANFVANKSPF